MATNLHTRRIVNLSPDFFEDRKLAKCSPRARLLLQCLWTMADRNGRLDDDEELIQSRAFLYDHEADVPALLEELVASRFISRYGAGDYRVIQIENWLRWQKPHKNQEALYPDRDGNLRPNADRAEHPTGRGPNGSEETNNQDDPWAVAVGEATIEQGKWFVREVATNWPEAKSDDSPSAWIGRRLGDDWRRRYADRMFSEMLSLIDRAIQRRDANLARTAPDEANGGDQCTE